MLKEISIEIIRKCPNRCMHCSSFSTENCSETIPFEVFKKIVEGAKKIGLKTVCFSGGEPFLHPDIVKMIEFVHKQGVNSYIYSRGIYMNGSSNRGPIPSAMFAQIADNVTKIIYNIEAVEENVYDTIMGTHGCFGFLRESIRRAVDVGITVEAHFVPNMINKDQIEQTLQYCTDLGISKVSFLRLVVHGRAYENRGKLLLPDEDLLKIERTLVKIKNEKTFNIRIGVPLLGETDECHCEAANGKLNIRYDGKVFPCEVFKNNFVEPLANCVPGNVFDNSIEDIYANSEYLKKVRELVQRHACNRDCEKCIGQYYLKRNIGG
ncbi:radical SAM protein [Mitsuokella sp.]